MAHPWVAVRQRAIPELRCDGEHLLYRVPSVWSCRLPFISPAHAVAGHCGGGSAQHRRLVSRARAEAPHRADGYSQLCRAALSPRSSSVEAPGAARRRSEATVHVAADPEASAAGHERSAPRPKPPCGRAVSGGGCTRRSAGGRGRRRRRRFTRSAPAHLLRQAWQGLRGDACDGDVVPDVAGGELLGQEFDRE